MILGCVSKIDPDCVLAVLDIACDALEGHILQDVVVGFGTEHLQPGMRATIQPRELSAKKGIH
jgi:hypothetical protein